MNQTEWDPRLYTARHAWVYDHGQSLVSVLDPQPGETILDLGCGTGQLTNMIAGTGAHVVAVDSSPTMVAAARAAYAELDIRLADAANLHLPEQFDAVFSNATLHWVHPPQEAAMGIARCLRPGGRLVAELGGRYNITRILTTFSTVVYQLLGIVINHPWYFPSISEYTALLENNQFEVRVASLWDRPTPLQDGPRGLRNWFNMFGFNLLSQIPLHEVSRIFEALEKQLYSSLWKDDQWVANYRRLRVVAVRL
ncbi:MAG: class I SAM-dependent methyltransferase [Herpetosiphon sp.]